MTSQMTLPPRALAGLLALAAIWGFSFLSIRVALDELGPFALVALRLAGAAAALWIVVLVQRAPLPRGGGIWASFLVLGLLNNLLPFGLITFGQQHIESGLASILNASTAIWGVLIAALLLPDERLTARKVAGVAFGFVGVSVAIGIGALQSLDLRSVGQISVLGAGLCYALAGVWVRKRLRGVSPVAASVGMLTCSTLMALPLALALEGPIPLLSLSGRTLAAMAYVSLVATAVAYLLYYRVIALAGSGNTSLVTLLVAPIAIVAGAVVLGEALAPRAYAGFALVALGLVVLDGRALAALRRRGRPARPAQKPLASSPPPR